MFRDRSAVIRCFRLGLTRLGLMAAVAVTGAVGLAHAQTPARPVLTDAVAGEWAGLVLKAVETEFPTKLSLVYESADAIGTPREHFPAFYGSFDWHSSVHGHWVLVRLLRQFPNLESAGRIREVLGRHLTAENLQAEADFFGREENKSFERMYGWAWLLRLAIELEQFSDDPEASQWRANLKPLENRLVDRAMVYLPLLTFPIRTGEHPDTGFALGQILDYARQTGKTDLEKLVVDRAIAFYQHDVDYPVRYEPSGHDFFSSGWNEADLMRRVLRGDDFEAWLQRFLPELPDRLRDGTIAPVVVSDMTDGKLVHLAGLNLNRAWCMAATANALRDDHPWRSTLQASADAHLIAGLATINSGHYEGDHWLATFGLYAISK